MNVRACIFGTAKADAGGREHLVTFKRVPRLCYASEFSPKIYDIDDPENRDSSLLQVGFKFLL